MIRRIKLFIKEYLFKKYIIEPRISYAHQDIGVKIYNNEIIPISKEQKSTITRFWQQYDVNHKIDFRWYDFYNTIDPSATHIEYYIPHDIFYGLVDTKLSNPIMAKYFDDKNLYDLIFHDVPQPKTIVRKDDEAILDVDYNIIDIETAINKCIEAKNIIAKPSVGSEGGAGIIFWDGTKDNIESLYNILNKNGQYIISEIAGQSPILNKIHKDSLNSIRIMSLMDGDEVIILSCVLRMGVNGNKVDNATSGGIFCGICDDGRLKDVAYNTLGKVIREHPQGGKLSNYIIPNIDKCKQLVKTCAPRLHRISKLCSWDLYIDQYDNPGLIEVNMTYGGVQIHQIPNGPIFGEHTSYILSKVFNKK